MKTAHYSRQIQIKLQFFQQIF